MAGRILNRRELRDQADEAERRQTAEPAAVDAVATEEEKAAPKKKRAKAKGPAVPKVRKPRAKKAPPRMRARWGVFDGGMKQVAVFDYNQRAAADEKLADLRVKHKGPYFMQIVKEPMPEPAAAEALPTT